VTPGIHPLRSFLFVVIGASLSTCTPAPDLLDQIIDQGVIRVVTRNSPTTFFLGPDSPKGIEFELARDFAHRIGVELEVATADRYWQVLPNVTDGNAHIAATGLAVDPADAAIVEFGPSYQSSRQQLIYRRGSKRPRDTADLVGKRIEVIADAPYAQTLREAANDLPDLTWTESSEFGIEDLVTRVANGQADYTIVDSNLFEVMRQYHPEARVAFDFGPPKPIAWALPKGAGRLREAVAAYFAEIKATGELQRLIDRYAANQHKFDYVGARAFMQHVSARLPLYRAQFELAGTETGIDWRLLAAIAYQESHWRHDAVSPTGVRGIMMLTEHAAAAVQISNREDPSESIIGGALYLRSMIEKLPERIAPTDRMWMGLAAYNIGFGHLEDARVVTQMNGGNADSWRDVRKYLPLLTEEQWFSKVRRGYARGDVPVQYVDNVRRYYQLLQWIGDDAMPAEPDDDTQTAAGPLTASLDRPVSDDSEKTL
jgi:membrane-bound lytic murein transglycosylase F